MRCQARELSVELIESWHSIQFNIEASLNDLQPWIAGVSSYDNHFSLSQSDCPLSSYQDQAARSVYRP